MSFATLLLLAFAMSTDAFAASLSKGTNLQAPRFINALKIGLIFGITEAITPIVGWLLGSAGQSFIEQWDHWIAFGLLSALGLHMIKASFGEDEGEEEENDEQSSSGGKNTLAATLLTAVGTSIDALTIGVSFAFLDVNILLAAAMIGAATTLMVTIGVLLGHRLGAMVGKKAEALGGVILVLVGCWILYSHLVA